MPLPSKATKTVALRSVKERRLPGPPSGPAVALTPFSKPLLKKEVALPQTRLFKIRLQFPADLLQYRGVASRIPKPKLRPRTRGTPANLMAAARASRQPLTSSDNVCEIKGLPVDSWNCTHAEAAPRGVCWHLRLSPSRPSDVHHVHRWAHPWCYRWGLLATDPAPHGSGPPATL